jgi:hypothetical protein
MPPVVDFAGRETFRIAMESQPIILLTRAEIMEGALVGAMRRINGVMARRREVHFVNGREGDGWTSDIEGALGEMALAKHLGRYWSDGSFRGGDVGDLQVRTTAHERGHLLLYPHDRDDSLFVLVVGKYGQYRIAGQILGAAGKQPEHWQEEKATYFVPQSVLARCAG